MILKQVHDTNMRAKGYPERVFSVSTSNQHGRHDVSERLWNLTKNFMRSDGWLSFLVFAFASSKVTTIKTVKQVDELVDSGTDTPVWQRYRLKIMSLSKQVG